MKMYVHSIVTSNNFLNEDNSPSQDLFYSYSTGITKSLFQRQVRMKIMEAFSVTCIGCGGRLYRDVSRFHRSRVSTYIGSVFAVRTYSLGSLLRDAVMHCPARP